MEPKKSFIKRIKDKINKNKVEIERYLVVIILTGGSGIDDIRWFLNKSIAKNYINNIKKDPTIKVYKSKIFKYKRKEKRHNEEY